MSRDLCWPPSASKWLDAFYMAHSASSNKSKKKALLDGFQLTNSSLANETLRYIEFYVLTKRGII